MDANKINFCNSSGFAIQNNRIKSDIINKIMNKYRVNINQYEKSYNDSFIPIMKKFNMFATLITRGKKYILYLTKINNENISLLIEATTQNGIFPRIIAVPLSIKDDMFNETIFIGEMLLYNQTWTFIIDDCRVNKGYTTYNKEPLDIVKLCNDFINNKFIPNKLEPFDIKVKKFFSISNIKQELNYNKLPLIGVQFIGLKNRIVFYFNSQNYNNENNTINLLPTYNNVSISKLQKLLMDEYETQDNINNEIILSDSKEKQRFTFEICKSDQYGIYNLFLYRNNIQVDMGIARINTIELNLELINIFKYNNKHKVTAYFNRYFNKWEVIGTTKNNLSNINDVLNYQQK